MSHLWRVRKRSNLLAPPWVVHDPFGNYTGAYPSWADAMAATRIGDRIETWLHSLT